MTHTHTLRKSAKFWLLSKGASQAKPRRGSPCSSSPCPWPCSSRPSRSASCSQDERRKSSGERPAATADPSASSGLACGGADCCESGGCCRLWEPLRTIRERQAAWRTAVLCACPVHTRELDQIVGAVIARFVSLQTGLGSGERALLEAVLLFEDERASRQAEEGVGQFRPEGHVAGTRPPAAPAPAPALY